MFRRIQAARVLWTSSQLRENVGGKGKREVNYLARSSIRSCLLMPSGISLGMAATHVRNKSIFGFLSPLWHRHFIGALLIRGVQRHGLQDTLNHDLATYVIMSSGSLLDICMLVMLIERPTSLSRCRKMLSKAFLTCG